MNKLLLLLLLSFAFYSSFLAQNNCTLTGKITDEKGNPIPYCSIYLPQVGSSSISNVEGNYSIKLPCAESEIVFQSIGFETKTIINRNSNELNVQLKVAIYQLKAVEIDESSEDIAYNYIRKATAMAEYYKKQITAYKAELYIRSYFDVKDIPWLFEKMINEEDQEILKTGNVTESIAEYSYKRPNEVKETIIATKSARNDSSRFGSGYINLSFYDLGGTDIINPLSRNAFQVYEYEHISTYFENEKGIHKIKIKPRRKGNDLMSGYIYINDKIWNINKVDVSFKVPVAEIDYQQQYAEIKENVWMPINHRFKVLAQVIGFKAEVNYLATINKIEVETDSAIDAKIEQHRSKRSEVPTATENRSASKLKDTKGAQKLTRQQKTEQKVSSLLQKERLNKVESLKLIRLIKKQERESVENPNEELEHQSNRKIEYADSAFAKNDSIWQNREVPLSAKEQDIYKAQDSLSRIKRAGTTYFNDTIHSPDSANLFSKILYYNGTIPSKNKNIRFRPKGIITGLGGSYNTVDGYSITKTLFDFEWNNREGKFYHFSPWIGYAFSRKALLGGINYESQYNASKRAGFYGSISRESVDFDTEYEFTPSSNSISTVFLESNYRKVYQINQLTFGHQFDIVNGLQVKTDLSYADRKQLFNTTSRTFIKLGDGEFTSNTPNNQHVLQNLSLIEDNKAILFKGSIQYTFKQHYTFDKHTKKKQLLFSHKPTLTFNYKKGISSNELESDSDFDFASFSIRQIFPFRLLNKVAYHFEVGKFFNRNSIAFADFKNFAANPSYLLNSNDIQSFGILDNYRFSANNYYLQGHLKINNDHILLKYLPLLNQTNWNEELKINHLYTEQNIHYSEVGYSLTDIFLFANVGAYVAFENGRYRNWEIRINLGFLDTINQ